jgi:hypothetical protein
MKKKIFTLFMLSFLLSGALSNVKAQNVQIGTIDLTGGFTIEVFTPRTVKYVFTKNTLPVYFKFSDAFKNATAIDQINGRKDTLRFYRNGVKEFDIIIGKYISMADLANYTYGWDVDAGDKTGKVTFSFEYVGGQGSGIAPGKIISTEYNAYDEPQVITNINGEELYDYFYNRTTQYAGKVEFTVTGGSPDLEYSLTNWATPVRKVYPKDYTGSQTIKLSALDIQNLIPGATIQVREPHYYNDGRKTFATYEVPEEPTVVGIPQRPIYIGEVKGATIIPSAGSTHFVPSGKNYVFKVIPTGENADLKPIVTTDRKFIPDEEGITYKVDEDGIWTITLIAVQEPVNLSISFPTTDSSTGNAAVDGNQVWGAAGAAYISSATAGSAKIYGAAGALVKTVTYSAGTTSIPLPAGFYIISKGGNDNYKVVVK